MHFHYCSISQSAHCSKKVYLGEIDILFPSERFTMNFKTFEKTEKQYMLQVSVGVALSLNPVSAAK